MGKKTKLRLAEGNELNPKLKNKLEEIIGEFEIEKFGPTADLRQSYQRRMDALSQAFLLIIETIPTLIGEKELQVYLRLCQEQFPLPPRASIDQYQTLLTDYTSLLVSALADYIKTDEKIDYIELLNKAEQYIIMREGRANIATLLPMKLDQLIPEEEIEEDSEQLILLFDKQLPAFTPETLAELSAIRKKKLLETPKWFRDLKPEQQLFFHSSPPSVTVADLKKELYGFQSEWVLNRQKNSFLLQELQNIPHNSKTFPSWWKKLSPHLKAAIKEIALSLTNLDQFDAYFNKIQELLDEMSLNPKGINEALDKIRSVPYWFLSLPNYEKRFLVAILNSSKHIEDSTSFVPSRLRTIPGLANGAAHFLTILDINGKTIKNYEPRFRSSHIASRDVKEASIRNLHTERNFSLIKTFSGQKPLFFQTLISPAWFLKYHMPDYNLDKERQKMVACAKDMDLELYTTNHALNKVGALTWTSSTNANCLELLKKAEQSLSSHEIENNLNRLMGKASGEQLEFWKELNNKIIYFIIENKNRSAYALLFSFFNSLPESWLESLKASCVNELGHSSLSRVEQAITQKALEEYNRLDAPDGLLSEMIKNDPVGGVFNKFGKEKFLQLYRCKGWIPILVMLLQLRDQQGLEQKELLNYTERLANLALLKQEYSALLNSAYGSATISDYHGRELFFSSVENLLFMHWHGVCYGSCVSGKDRKLIELIHTSAMLLYRDKYGFWPSFTDSGPLRTNFINIIVELYSSRHGHEFAGQNAWGCEGIKTPAGYWPGDVATAICRHRGEKALEEDDRLASNNEVKKIGSITLKPGYASCILAASKLSSKNRADLLMQIKIIVEEKDNWADKVYTPKAYTPKFMRTILPAKVMGAPAPKGINRIRQLLQKWINSVPGVRTSPAYGIKILAKIYAIVKERQANTSPQRKPETQAFYDTLAEIYNAIDPEKEIRTVLGSLQDIKKNSFKYNKTRGLA